MTIVQEKTTRVGGMTIFYREAGAGEPILLLHGVPTSSYLWRRTHLSVGTRPRLAAFGRAVAPDHYGFGKSDKPADADYSVPGYVRYLEGFTAALGLDRLHLIVHDFGGPFGLAFAIAHPERTRSLVILNTIFFSTPSDHPEWEGRLRRLGVPALIIWGRRDPFLPSLWAERFHRDLKGSALAILDDAGHFVQEDQPEKVARLIEAFYARRPS